MERSKEKVNPKHTSKKMQQDPFDSETYELQDYYFQYEDFAVFLTVI